MGKHKLLLSYQKCHSIPTSACQACPLKLLSKSNHMFCSKKYSKSAGSAITKSTYQSIPMPIKVNREVIVSLKWPVSSMLPSIQYLVSTFFQLFNRHFLSLRHSLAATSCCAACHNTSVKKRYPGPILSWDDLGASWTWGQSVKERTGIVWTQDHHATTLVSAAVHTVWGLSDYIGHADRPQSWRLRGYFNPNQPIFMKPNCY